MEIHILLAGVEFGPYTDDKARELVAEGFLSPTDPAKRLDETEWLPLTEVLAHAPEEPAEEIPSPEEPWVFEENEPVVSTPAAEEPPGEQEPEAQEPSFPEEQPEPEPEIVPPPVSRSEISTRSATRFSPIASSRLARPGATSSAPFATVAPKIQVAVPTRAKTPGGLRTGTLLAKEALEAARQRVGAATPAAFTAPLPEVTRPSPEIVSEPSSSPSTSAPLTKTRSKIVLKDREAQEEPPSISKTRKTIRLTQPIGLGSTASSGILPPTRPEFSLPKATPALKAPEPNLGTGKIRIGQFTRTKPLSTGRKTAPVGFRTPSSPPPEKETPLPEAPPLVDSAPLPAPGALTSSGDLAEKRSLKITGALKQSAPRIPVRLTTTFPYQPGDSGKLGLRSDEATSLRPPSQPLSPEKKIWGPEAPAARTSFPITPLAPPSAPLDSPQLTIRPPSTKIPVSEMPPEGLKVRGTRRLTGRIPIPEQAKPPQEEVPAPDEVAAPVSEGVEAPELPAPKIAEALAAPPDVALPEKVRLRQPVKLELSSRAKDSGRLAMPPSFPTNATALTKSGVPLSSTPESEPPVPRPGTPTEERTEVPPAELKGTAETVPLTTVEDFPPHRLSEVKTLAKPATKPKRREKWLWVAYAIIALGMLAWLLLLYLATHRKPVTVAAANSSAPSAPASTSPAAPPAPTATDQNPGPTTPSSDNEEQVKAYVSDGKGSFQKGDLDGALAAFNHALDLDPRSPDALYNRGLTKAQQDDSDGAISDFSQALQVDPKLAGAYYARGLARHSKGDLDGAISDYNLAVQNDPKLALAFFNRGLIRMQKDDIDGAIVDSGRALELDPRLIQSYYNRGLGRLAKGTLDAALSDMTTFCTLAPQDAYTDYARLYVWLIRTQQGQLAEANQELSQAMNSGWNGSADSMVTRLGEFLLGQIGESDLMAAAASPIPVKDQGQHCEAWYFTGMRRLEAGDKETAAIDLRKCVETQKTDYCEYILAQEQLKTLNPGGVATGNAATSK
jgi:tetratricopeptide (TPR) repeat protein